MIHRESLETGCPNRQLHVRVPILAARQGRESGRRLDCSTVEARERINKRANANPTPEDNLWCSPQRPEFPDKFDYQNVDAAAFRQEYERRLRIHAGSDYREIGEQLFLRFNASKEDQLWYYGELVETLRKKPAPKPLV